MAGRFSNIRRRQRRARRAKVGRLRSLPFKATRNLRTGGFLGLEMKFVDTQAVSDAFTSTWATMEDATNDSVSGVAQGDGESNRDGRKYLIHSIHIKARAHVIEIESATAPLPDLFGRICLVWDTQTNGAQLTATDVMDGGQSNDELAFRNLQHSKRFRVLWDKKFIIKRSNTNEGSINLFASNPTSTPIMVFNRVFKKPIPVICSGTTAVVANISDNSLHMIGVANSSTCLLTYQVRLRFTG